MFLYYRDNDGLYILIREGDDSFDTSNLTQVTEEEYLASLPVEEVDTPPTNTPVTSNVTPTFPVQIGELGDVIETYLSEFNTTDEITYESINQFVLNYFIQQENEEVFEFVNDFVGILSADGVLTELDDQLLNIITSEIYGVDGLTLSSFT